MEGVGVGRRKVGSEAWEPWRFMEIEEEEEENEERIVKEERGGVVGFFI